MNMENTQTEKIISELRSTSRPSYDVVSKKLGIPLAIVKTAAQSNINKWCPESRVQR